MSDWTGQWTVARVVDGEAVWETLRQAEAREPIVPVGVSIRQLEILRFLAAYKREHAGMPSLSQISAAVRLSRNGVVYQLNALEAKGLISRARRHFSAIVLNVSI